MSEDTHTKRVKRAKGEEREGPQSGSGMLAFQEDTGSDPSSDVHRARVLW